MNSNSDVPQNATSEAARNNAPETEVPTLSSANTIKTMTRVIGQVIGMHPLITNPYLG